MFKVFTIIFIVCMIVALGIFLKDYVANRKREQKKIEVANKIFTEEERKNLK